MTKILRNGYFWENDREALIDAKRNANCHKIHHKGGPTQAGGKVEILTTWASSNLKGEMKGGEKG